MKFLLSFFFLLSLSYPAFASKSQLGVKFGTWNFTTENVGSEDGEASGVGAYSFDMGYSLSQSWLAVFAFNLVMTDVFTGSSGYGLDVGGKYFPVTRSLSQDMNTDYTSISISETFRPYVGFFMRQRIFGLEQSVSYLGPGIGLGFDYALWARTTLSLEFRYDYLFGRGDGVAIQNNILLGFSLELD